MFRPKQVNLTENTLRVKILPEKSEPNSKYPGRESFALNKWT